MGENTIKGHEYKELKTRTISAISLPQSTIYLDFPGGSDSKEFVCNARDPGSIPESGRSPEEGHGNPLHYSCLGNPMDRGTWQAIVHRITESGTTEHAHTDVGNCP